MYCLLRCVHTELKGTKMRTFSSVNFYSVQSGIRKKIQYHLQNISVNVFYRWCKLALTVHSQYVNSKAKKEKIGSFTCVDHIER